jgi:hypothetical protein
MSNVKKYRVIKDIPFQFLQLELKAGMIFTYHNSDDVYYLLGMYEKRSILKIKRQIIEGWSEYFELMTED